MLKLTASYTTSQGSIMSFDVKNNMKVRALSKRLNLEVGMSTSIAVEQAMTYLKEAMQKRNVDSIKAAELLRWWLSDFQDEELEYFETRVDLANQVKLVDTRRKQA
jgi:predicted RNase H-related nuclease YkuK (DUF458 family)